jgi:hypothetical protein
MENAPEVHRMPNEYLYEMFTSKRGISTYIVYLSQFAGVTPSQVREVGFQAANMVRV